MVYGFGRKGNQPGLSSAKMRNYQKGYGFDQKALLKHARQWCNQVLTKEGQEVIEG